MMTRVVFVPTIFSLADLWGERCTLRLLWGERRPQHYSVEEPQDAGFQRVHSGCYKTRTGGRRSHTWTRQVSARHNEAQYEEKVSDKQEVVVSKPKKTEFEKSPKFDIPKSVKKDIKFVFASTMEDVLPTALTKWPIVKVKRVTKPLRPSFIASNW